MENLLNPVIVAVLLLCVLCLLKVNVLLSMLVSLFVAGLIGGLPLVGDDSIMSSVIAGFSGNAETALAYVLLGTFALLWLIPVSQKSFPKKLREQ